MACLFQTRLIKLCVMLIVILIVLLVMQHNHVMWTWRNLSSPQKPTLPTLARILYLFLCENQNEVDEYANALPSISADVMFLCWEEDCMNKKFSTLSTIYTSVWLRKNLSSRLFISLQPSTDLISIQPRVFIINEKQFKLPRKTTWTTARNILYMNKH